MIDSLFDVLVVKSIGLTILLMVILSIRPTILKLSNARVAYGFWLMLPVYLLLPINFVQATSTGGIMTVILGSESVQLPSTPSDWFVLHDATRLLLLVWLVGFLIMLIGFLFKYYRIKLSLQVFSSNQLVTGWKEAEIKLNSAVKVVKSDLIGVPGVFGLFRSYLVLPQSFATLPQSSQRMILQHELYHLSRHDHRYNFLRVFIKSLFWFNPLVYWADRYCEADQEISCDLGVLQNSKSESRLAYAKVLLESVTGNRSHRLISQWKYQSLIKERVTMLKNIKARKWHSWVAAVFAVSAIWMTSGVVMAEKEVITDKEAIPMTIIQPRYPRKAAEEGVEGWVKIKFDLDNSGSPYNLEVLDAEPQDVFERDSLRAIQQWKFKVTKLQENLIYTMQFRLAPTEEEFGELLKTQRNDKLVKLPLQPIFDKDHNPEK